MKKEKQLKESITSYDDNYDAVNGWQITEALWIFLKMGAYERTPSNYTSTKQFDIRCARGVLSIGFPFIMVVDLLHRLHAIWWKVFVFVFVHFVFNNEMHSDSSIQICDLWLDDWGVLCLELLQKSISFLWKESRWIMSWELIQFIFVNHAIKMDS